MKLSKSKTQPGPLWIKLLSQIYHRIKAKRNRQTDEIIYQDWHVPAYIAKQIQKEEAKSSSTYPYSPKNHDLTGRRGRERSICKITLNNTSYTLIAKFCPGYQKVNFDTLSLLWVFYIRVENATRKHDVDMGYPSFDVRDQRYVSLMFTNPEYISYYSTQKDSLTRYTEEELEDFNRACDLLTQNSWQTLYATAARIDWQSSRLTLATEGTFAFIDTIFDPAVRGKRAQYQLYFAQIKHLQTAQLAISLFESATSGKKPQDWPKPQEFESLASLALN